MGYVAKAAFYKDIALFTLREVLVLPKIMLDEFRGQLFKLMGNRVKR